ncbi:MAG: class I SAM-dependent methyltransferase [Kiritimatiellia bacterium]
MPASSSYHSFNMDRPRPAGSIRLWMAVNHLLHRLDGARGPGRLETSRFRPEWDEAFWSAMQPGLSPSRAWCNWFWSGLPWKGIRRALGRLDVLDLGCGSGAYARQWDAWSGGLDRYTGVDFTARDAWTGVNAGPGRTFHASDIIRYVQANPVSATLLLSQSALEHFPEDTRLMNLLRDRVMTAGGPRLQVHLVPSAACLALYREHGVRQYTPRSVGRLLAGYRGTDARCRLVGLGARPGTGFIMNGSPPRSWPAGATGGQPNPRATRPL